MRFRWILPITALALATVSQTAWPGAEEDYQAGMESFNKHGDVFNAMPLLRKAADAGHTKAMAKLAYFLDYSEFDEEARKYYRMASDLGDVDGHFGLASMLSSGEGGQRNLSDARRLFTLSAEQGHKQAVEVLAQAYISGKLDIPESELQSAEALKWIKLAAEKDYLAAMKALADAYRTGGYGLEVDNAAADALQTRYYDLQGLDKKGKPKKKRK